MINPIRAWVRLIIRSLPKKHWREDPEKIKSVAIARITGTLVMLTVTMAYYVLDAIFPAYKHLWGISFLAVTLGLYCLIWERILRVVKYHVRLRDKNSNTRR